MIDFGHGPGASRPGEAEISQIALPGSTWRKSPEKRIGVGKATVLSGSEGWGAGSGNDYLTVSFALTLVVLP